MTAGGSPRRGPVMVLVVALALVAGVLLPSASAVAGQRTMSVLQLNLCNSGRAACYRTYNQGGAVTEAIAVIAGLAQKPDVLTFNEICRNDLAAIAESTGYAGATSAFFPVLRRESAPVTTSSITNMKCTNRPGYHDQDFGIGVLIRDATARATVARYRAFTAQDTGTSDEVRVMACLTARRIDVCAAHLAQPSGNRPNTIALRQCQELMALAGDQARHRATVVAGDLNLAHRGVPDMRSCVPHGFAGSSDGHVQHVLASTAHLVPVSVRTVPLNRTDHDALLVTLRHIEAP